MTPEDLQAHDESRALVLALIELLNSKLMPGHFVKLLSNEDVKALMQRKDEMVDRFKKERRDAASALLLPPGARS